MRIRQSKVDARVCGKIARIIVAADGLSTFYRGSLQHSLRIFRQLSALDDQDPRSRLYFRNDPADGL